MPPRASRRVAAQVETHNVLVLPQEIIDMTIDQLKDDFGSLRALGLVARAWYQRTREHLFRAIQLGEKKPKLRSKQLVKILRERPILCRYIEELTICDTTTQSSRDDSFSAGWLASCPSVLEILPLFTSVFLFSLVGKPYFNWSMLPSQLQIALYEMMARATTTHLFLIVVVDIDITVLSTFHHLKELTLSSVETSHSSSIKSGACFPLNTSSSPPSLHTEHHHLELLDVTNSGDAIQTLITCARSSEGAVNMSEITELSVGTLDFDYDMKGTWDDIITICGPTVEKYEVIQDVTTPLDEADPFPPAVFAFGHFPKLKELIVNMTYHYFHTRGHNPFPIFLHELETLSRESIPSNLETVDLEFDFRRIDDIEGDLDITADVQTFASKHVWCVLDDILSRPAFPKLRELSILFDITYCTISDSDWEQAMVAVAAHMSNLHGSRKIVKLASVRQPPDIR